MIPTTKAERVERGLQQAMRDGIVTSFTTHRGPSNRPSFIVKVRGDEQEMTLARAEAFCIGVKAAQDLHARSDMCEQCGGTAEIRHSPACSVSIADDRSEAMNSLGAF